MESKVETRSGSHQKTLNNSHRPPIANGTHSLPPTSIPVKSATKSSTTPPRKNGETHRSTLPLREPVSIPIERVASVTNTQPTEVENPPVPEKVVNTIHIKTDPVKDTRDRRHRSRTLEAHQIQAVDNQIYGCPSKAKQGAAQHRSESHKHRGNRLSLRRSSEDTQDKQLQLRRNNEYYATSGQDGSNESWFEIDKDHWTNLLENGWRPTVGTPGVTPVAIANPGMNDSRLFSHNIDHCV